MRLKLYLNKKIVNYFIVKSKENNECYYKNWLESS